MKKKIMLALSVSAIFATVTSAENLADLSGICYFTGGNGDAALRTSQNKASIVYVALKKNDVERVKKEAVAKGLLNKNFILGNIQKK